MAKQAAAVDVLSAGRLRLGVGVGWNAVEFEALGERFTNRGARIEEQVAVLGALWARDLVTIEGQWHRVTDAGLNPLPPRPTVPIWMGGESESVARRVRYRGAHDAGAGTPERRRAELAAWREMQALERFKKHLLT